MPLLTQEQRNYLLKLQGLERHKGFNSTFTLNLENMLKHGMYSSMQQEHMNNVVRKRYTEFMKNQK